MKENAARRVTGLIVAMVAALAACQLVDRVGAQQQSASPSPGRSAAIDASLADPEPTHRLREGSVLTDHLGTFKVSGDRVVFLPERQQDSLLVLENLALERVWKMLDESRGRQWSVTGVITEYRGRNYFLIERVVLKARPAAAAASP